MYDSNIASPTLLLRNACFVQRFWPFNILTKILALLKTMLNIVWFTYFPIGLTVSMKRVLRKPEVLDFCTRNLKQTQ